MLSILKNIYDLFLSVTEIISSNRVIRTTNANPNIVEKGNVYVTSQTSYTVAFSEPRANYIPYVAINDNLNIWFTSITSSGFTVNFSAPYTGTIYYCAIL